MLQVATCNYRKRGNDLITGEGWW